MSLPLACEITSPYKLALRPTISTWAQGCWGHTQLQPALQTPPLKVLANLLLYPLLWHSAQSDWPIYEVLYVVIIIIVVCVHLTYEIQGVAWLRLLLLLKCRSSWNTGGLKSFMSLVDKFYLKIYSSFKSSHMKRAPATSPHMAR